MELQEFENALDRFGGRIEAWPPPMGAEAAAMLATSAAARRSHEALLAAENVLKASRGSNAASLPLARITAARQARWAGPVPARAGLACAFATALTLGFLLGDAWPSPNDTPEHALQAAFSTTETLDAD